MSKTNKIHTKQCRLRPALTKANARPLIPEIPIFKITLKVFYFLLFCFALLIIVLVSFCISIVLFALVLFLLFSVLFLCFLNGLLAYMLYFWFALVSEKRVSFPSPSYTPSSLPRELVTMPQTLETLRDNFFSSFPNDDLVEVVDTFRREKPLRQMMSYLWTLPEAHRHLTPGWDEGGKKDAHKADEARLRGNDFFPRGLNVALIEYNRSILLAPHPPLHPYPIVGQELDDSESFSTDFEPFLLPEVTDPTTGALSLAYANRAAVWIEMKKYVFCLRDIDLSLKFGYPKKMRHKLVKRWARCLLALGDISSARQVLLGALSAVDTILWDEGTRGEVAGELLRMAVMLGPFQFSLPHYPRAPHYIESSTYREARKHQPNPTIPALSKAVQMVHTGRKGRHLVAERDIKPGEVLCAEKRFASLLHLGPKDCLCATCHLFSLCYFPCPQCSQAVFCSLHCQQEALSGFHFTECSIGSSLASLCLPPHVLLACRVLTTTSFETLKEEESRLHHEASTRRRTTLGFNQAGKYISSDYRTVYHLATDQHKRPHLDIFNACISAFVVLKLLQRGGRFFREKGHEVVPSDEDLMLVGTALCSHILSLSCNSRTIHAQFPAEAGTIMVCPAGLGVFPAVSLANHSCDPTATFVTAGAVGLLVALRSIPKGGEVTCSYGVTHSEIGRERRRALLLEAFHFECQCKACEKDWPLTENLPGSVALKCLKCSKEIDLQRPFCTRCNLNFGRFGTPTKGKRKRKTDEYFASEIAQKIELAREKFAICCDINSACDLLQLLDQYTTHPSRLGFEARTFLEQNLKALALKYCVS